MGGVSSCEIALPVIAVARSKIALEMANVVLGRDARHWCVDVRICPKMSVERQELEDVENGRDDFGDTPGI